MLCHFCEKELLSFFDGIVRARLFFLIAFIDVVTIREEQTIAETRLLTEREWIEKTHLVFAMFALFYRDNVKKKVMRKKRRALMITLANDNNSSSQK